MGVYTVALGYIWNMDGTGPYAVKAIGGYSMDYMLAERSVGMVELFGIKSKTEAFACVRHLWAFCALHGHPIGILLVDADTVMGAPGFCGAVCSNQWT